MSFYIYDKCMYCINYVWTWWDLPYFWGEGIP